MRALNERLDQLREKLQTPDFLAGEGLSNEKNIRIFCYDPADELAVAHFVNQLRADQALECHIIEFDMYQTFLQICEDLDITDAIPEMEAADGSEFLLQQLHMAVGADVYIDRIQYSPHQRGDVLLVTGVGNAFPFMRVHSILEALQPAFSDIPIVIMYPGQYSGNDLRLFGKLRPNNYYRAFNEIAEED